MATGFDIIFFWVARMVMMGIHFGKDIPFKEVYINGLIRDDKGRKMSKTKNNVIDPLVIIKEYGADALRFTLAIQSVPGMDISLSISRIKGYKGFLNKIWNASRYILMNLKGNEDNDFDINGISDTDKWMLHTMNKTVAKINDFIDSYRINDGVLIVVNAYGINPFTIDSALEGKRRGIPTIGVTSTSFAEKVPRDHQARHKSGESLHEIVDVFVDCHLPYGDAAVKFENLEQKVAPTATLANTFTVNLLVVETVSILLDKGFTPPLWKSANVPGGDESNLKYENEFGGRIKHLL
jgi:hypothetical protein